MSVFNSAQAGIASAAASGEPINTGANLTILDHIISTSDIFLASHVAVDSARQILFVCAYFGDEVTSYDISDPSNMVKYSNLADGTNLNAASRLIYDDVNEDLYVLCLADRLTVVDVSNPSAMTITDSILDTTQLDYCTGFDKSGDYIFCYSMLKERITSVDVSTPASLSIADSVVDPTPLMYGGITGQGGLVIDKTNDVAWIGAVSDDSITSWDISTPTAMTQLGQTSSATNLNGASVLAIDEARQVLFVGNYHDNGIAAVDISTATAPSFISKLVDATYMTNVQDITYDEAAQILYVAGYSDDTVVSVDVSNTSSMSIIDTITSSTQLDGVKGLAIDGSTLYTASLTGSEIASIDIT